MKKVLKKSLFFLIDLYQTVLAGLFSMLGVHKENSCPFYPSCSVYAREAVARHGARRGAWLAAKRLVRCHPWRKPTIDQVPF